MSKYEIDDSEKTGPAFAARRKAMRLTQAALATEMGINVRTVQDLESGRSRVRSIHIMALDFISIKIAGKRRDATVLVPRLKETLLKIVEAENAQRGN